MSARGELDPAKAVEGRVRGDISGEDAASDSGIGERLGSSPCP